MPEIGTMLREARMRAGLDISEIEAETKIRAKYLRALENEEWGLLPGQTYVKSFLRTYSERLGLDAHLIVEEYKLRHETPSEFELQPVRPPARRGRGPGPVPDRPAVPRWLVGGGLLAALLVALYVLGSGGGHTSSIPSVSTHTAPTHGRTTTTSAVGAAPTRTRVALQLVPSGPVWVCLIDSIGTRLLNGVTLAPGAKQPVYHSRRFDMTLGNGSLQMRINGVLRPVPQVNNAIGYELTRLGRKVLDPTKRPTCA
jgi:hypothetical protein